MTDKSISAKRIAGSSHDGLVSSTITSFAKSSIDDGWILCPKLDALLSLRKPLGQLTPSHLVINVASVEELCGLPGLGRKRAERIVAYRKSHGPFASISELSIISGIGKRIVDGLVAVS